MSLSVGISLCIYHNTFAYAEDIDNEEVYLGGFPIGIDAKSQYFIVDELINVTSSNGSFSPALLAGVEKGDLLVTINGKIISGPETIADAVKSGNEIVLSVKRGRKLIDISIKPEYDVTQKTYKLGFGIKNDLIGIGTMTFLTKDGRFGALGHLIEDEFGHSSVYQSGNIFPCTVTGYNVAEPNVPGELRGAVDFSDSIGKIEKNVFCGIFGSFSVEMNDLKKVTIGSKTDVRPGKAEILTTIDDKGPKLYEIDIIKVVEQDKPADKSMVIRVTDKRLKMTTGGILQGMSGSPIIQNGKLVGAVTHVFNADATKGYGVYIDWMLEEII
ncbi:MAG: SpoIVB peptidase [Clostridia bacterium]|nr:SpoIVB peptidase [Clostridia bacterium]